MSIYIDIHIIELYFLHSHTISGRYAVKICFPVQENKGFSRIGGGALHKINKSGLRFFQAQQGTITQNKELFANDNLPEFMPG
jgi:hypothetical protein